MAGYKPTINDLSLIGANLVPVYGVWFLHWNPHQIFLVYCLETILLGIFTLAKLAISGLNPRPAAKGPSWSIAGYMLFFALHYGIFVFVQLNIFLGVSAGAFGTDSAVSLILHLDRYLLPGYQWSLLLFGATYGLILFRDFVLTGAYRNAEPGQLMFEPYGRILIQQFTVILGSMFLMFGAGKIFMTLFAGFKTFFDIRQPFKKSLEEAGRKMKEIS